MALQVPVFLCVAEIGSGKIFFAAVKRQVRARYGRFLRFNSFGFRCFRITDLTTPMGHHALQTEYARERGHEQFVSRIHDLVAHRVRYVELFLASKQVAPYTVVRHTDWATSAQLAQTCVTILRRFAGGSEIRRLEKEWRRLQKVQVLQDAEPSGHVYLDTLRSLYPLFVRCSDTVKRYVTRTQAPYWRSTDPTVYAMCTAMPEGRLPSCEHLE